MKRYTLEDYANLTEQILAGSKPIIYYPNSGNAGDALINHGTYNYFNAINLDYRMASAGKDAKGCRFLYGGGGALTPEYKTFDNFVKSCSEGNDLIILPHSVSVDLTPYLSKFKSITVFAREQKTFDSVSKMEGIDCQLCPDMAFMSDTKALLGRFPLGVIAEAITHPQRAAFFRVIKHILGRKLRPGKRKAEPLVNCFRTDVESTGRPIPAFNRDITGFFHTESKSEREAFLMSSLVLKFLNSYSSVKTDRLHVSISCSLLHIPVELEENSYWKNRAVYDHSFRGVESSVTFASQEP